MINLSAADVIHSQCNSDNRLGTLQQYFMVSWFIWYDYMNIEPLYNLILNKFILFCEFIKTIITYLKCIFCAIHMMIEEYEYTTMNNDNEVYIYWFQYSIQYSIFMEYILFFPFAYYNNIYIILLNSINTMRYIPTYLKH